MSAVTRSAGERAFGAGFEHASGGGKFLIGVGLTLFNPICLLNFGMYTALSSLPKVLAVYDFLLGNLGRFTTLTLSKMLENFKKHTYSGCALGLLYLVGGLGMSALVYSAPLCAAVAPIASVVGSLVAQLPAVLSAVASAVNAVTLAGVLGLLSVVISSVGTALKLAFSKKGVAQQKPLARVATVIMDASPNHPNDKHSDSSGEEDDAGLTNGTSGV